jgi:hypothetical protein
MQDKNCLPKREEFFIVEPKIVAVFKKWQLLKDSQGSIFRAFFDALKIDKFWRYKIVHFILHLHFDDFIDYCSQPALSGP